MTKERIESEYLVTEYNRLLSLLPLVEHDNDRLSSLGGFVWYDTATSNKSNSVSGSLINRDVHH